MIRFQLLVTIGSDDPKQFKLCTEGSNVIRIGRGTSNDSCQRLPPRCWLNSTSDMLSIEDEAVSEKHLQLFSKQGELHFQDLGSTHGTKYDGKRVTIKDGSYPVKVGTELEIGEETSIKVKRLVFETDRSEIGKYYPVLLL